MPILDLVSRLGFEDEDEATLFCQYYGLMDVHEDASEIRFGRKSFIGLALTF